METLSVEIDFLEWSRVLGYMITQCFRRTSINRGLNRSMIEDKAFSHRNIINFRSYTDIIQRDGRTDIEDDWQQQKKRNNVKQ
jgi:hypothetical protein